jgi:hypothetical protein
VGHKGWAGKPKPNDAIRNSQKAVGVTANCLCRLSGRIAQFAEVSKRL